MSFENSPAQRVAGVSPSTILSLPNDLLHPVMQEVYDAGLPQLRERPISQIMINKRIFAVARSIWFSRLAIYGPGADQQLTALADDDVRRQSLKHLEVKVGDFAHLYDVAHSRQFPRLAKLTIHFSVHPKNIPVWAIDKVVARIGSLRHLELHLEQDDHYSMDTWKSIYTTFNFTHLLSLSCFVSKTLLGRIGSTFRMEAQVPRDIDASIWAGLTSYEILPQTADNGCGRLVDSLKATLAGSSAEASTILLRRLSLSLLQTHGRTFRRLNGLSSSDFITLLRLLPNTAISHLQFTTVSSIPPISEEIPLARTVRVLKLSSLFNLKEQGNLEHLSQLLLQFPSLTHVHLVGERLFGLSTTVESLASDSDADIFLHPELSTLLLWLRTSNVKVFTYRGGEEAKREVRWIRKGETPDEKFERDCWTL